MADINALVLKLEGRVQPSDDFYKFSTDDLQDELMDAMDELDPDLTFDILSKSQERLVMYKAMSSCFYILAGKHAENIRFKIENDEYHGQQVNPAYFKQAEKYETLFNDSKGIEVHTVTRTLMGTGLKATYTAGDTP